MQAHVIGPIISSGRSDLIPLESPPHTSIFVPTLLPLPTFRRSLTPLKIYQHKFPISPSPRCLPACTPRNPSIFEFLDVVHDTYSSHHLLLVPYENIYMSWNEKSTTLYSWLYVYSISKGEAGSILPLCLIGFQSFMEYCPWFILPLFHNDCPTSHSFFILKCLSNKHFGT